MSEEAARNMPELSAEQLKVLRYADKFGVIREGDYDICPGIHFCPDWDGLVVFNDSPEAECCSCGPILHPETTNEAN